MKIIFVVDDSLTSLTIAKNALKGHYRFLPMKSARQMFVVLSEVTPDLILLDIEMPEMDGFEALMRLKQSRSHANIPVIFLTANPAPAIEAHCLEMGAVDFITKPFSAPVLLNRIKIHLDIDALVRERTAQIKRLQDGIVTVLADIVEERDMETGGHNDRTAEYIKILIQAMRERGVYAGEINEWVLETVIPSARLHDMGKIHVIDSVLNKQGKLDESEYEKMKFHTVEGARIIDRMIEHTGEGAFLRSAKLFAEYHHERWDGAGYPHGLKGEDIPLQGRIMAVVDVYDALVSRRAYKKAFKDEDAVQIIAAESGRHFDPKIVKVFLDIQAQVKEARESLYRAQAD
jgi:putative two-component system response regulator